MFAAFWNDWLYQPLFNFLIWLYNNWTNLNFGWAVVWLTVLLRVILLPFTLISERDKVKNRELAKEVARLEREFHHDPVLKKQEIRRVLKKRSVHPWAKIIVLGVQLLVLILLYQVFLRGITNDKIIKILYPFVDFPGKINTDFYGFDLGRRHDTFWAGIVGLFFFTEIYFAYRKSKLTLAKRDLMYFFLFPFSVFILLWALPMVKSIFVLTSLLFSVIIDQFSKVLFKPKKAVKAPH